MSAVDDQKSQELSQKVKKVNDDSSGNKSGKR